MTQSMQIEGGAIAVPSRSDQGVRVFKGLRYAAPPLGDLRWRPPQPVPAWSGVKPVDRFGANALQGVIWDDIDPTVAGVSEDCLFLNVWTPAELATRDRLPVMVWIHGGGFVVGSGAEPRYDGASLAARGIVVVTLNHRLNALGYLALAELTEESEHGASGHYAMLDLIAALGWVRRNIAAFGGDPDQVTIAGESAGSMAVSVLMASPLAKGLFARAIGESGAMFASPGNVPAMRPDAEIAGLKFMRKAGARNLAQLRALPAQAILAAAPGLGFRPIVDGYVLPHAPADIFAAGVQNDVPLMAGWNKDEGFNFTLLQGGGLWRSFKQHVRSIFGPSAAEALTHYSSGTAEKDAASASTLGGDLTIVHGAWAWIAAQMATGRSEIFQFQFDRAPLTPQGWFGQRDSREAGAFHSGEIPYVFDTLHVFPWLIEDADHQVAHLTTSYWLNFVKTGNPNGDQLPAWPSRRGPGSPVMRLDWPAHAAPETGRERHLFLAKVVTATAQQSGALQS